MNGQLKFLCELKSSFNIFTLETLPSYLKCKNEMRWNNPKIHKLAA